MNRIRQKVLGVILCLGVWSQITAVDLVTFHDLPASVTVRSPFVAELRAVTFDGRLDTNFSGDAALRAHGRQPPPLVVSEFTDAGETWEFTNPGATPLKVGGWQLEAVRNSSDFRVVRELPAGSVVPPGGVLMWTSRTNVTEAWPWLRSDRPFELSVMQVRDSAGRVVDQVYLGGANAEIERLWNGPGFPLHRVTTNSHERHGVDNHFQVVDWEIQPGSVGQLNTNLSLPWVGRRVPVSVEPSTVRFTNGIWRGPITLEHAGHVSLAADDGRGRLSESAVFIVLPEPALPPLELELVGETAVTREAQPGTNLTARLRLSLDPGTNVLVRLSGGTPGEFTVPATLEVPANGITFPLVNHDDAEADGRAVVTITATADGFAPAALTVFNDDNEAGELFLQLPATAAEGAGRLAEQGLVILARPIAHPVEVTLEADPLLSVPARVIIPAGRQSAAFPLRVRDDELVNRQLRRVRVTATMNGWPAASETMVITDDESGHFRFEWPQELVEGNVATGRFIFDAARDHPVAVRFEGGSEQVPAPPPQLIPAGTRLAEFVIGVPDNTMTNDTTSTQLCLWLDDFFVECRNFAVRDNEVELLGVHEFYPPVAVFSGQPFELELRLQSRAPIPGAVVHPGTVQVADSGAASVANGSQPVSFRGGEFRGPVTVTGETLGARLEVASGGFSWTSRPFDVLPGYGRSGAMLDLAAWPGRPTLLISSGSETNITGLLLELDPETGNVLRELPLPRPARRIAVSADGSVAWLASVRESLQRIDLTAWRVDREVPLGTPATGLSAMAVGVLSGGTQRVVVVLFDDNAPAPRNRLIAAYDQGQRLAQAVPINAGTIQNEVLPGRTPEEAFVGIVQTLNRITVGLEGVMLTHQRPGIADSLSHPNLRLVGDRLYTGNALVLTADSLEPVQDFAAAGLHVNQHALVAPFPELGLAAFMDGQFRFLAQDLDTGELRGRHALPFASQSFAPGRLATWGRNRLALLFDEGRQLAVWGSPLLTDVGADLGLTVEAPAQFTLPGADNGQLPAEFFWQVTVTNRGPGTAHGVGLTYELLSQEVDTLEPVQFGTLAPGETRSLSVRRSSYSLGPMRTRVLLQASTPDPNRADNIVVAETAILAAVTPATRVLALDFNELEVGQLVVSPTEDRLFVIVRRIPGGEEAGVLDINPVTGTIEAILRPGEDPRRLAITADGTALFVQLGPNRLVRWNLAEQRVEVDLPFSTEQVVEFVPLPDDPEAVAVATSRRVAVYDGAVQRASVNMTQTNQRHLAWAADRLWVSHSGTLRSFQVHTNALAVSGPDIPLTSPWYDFNGFVGDDRRLYFINGTVDIATRQISGGPPGNRFLPEPALGVVYGNYFRSIQRYDRVTDTMLAAEPLPALGGDNIQEFVRWGEDGLAVRSGSQLLMYRSAAVPAGVADLAVSLDLPPTLLAFDPFRVTLTVTNRSPMPAPRVRFWLSARGNLRDLVISPPAALSGGGYYGYELAELAGGAATQVTLEGWSFIGSPEFRAGVVAGVTDPVTENNVVNRYVGVNIPTADIGIHSLTFPARVEAGSEFEAVLTLTNAGPDTVLDPSVRLGDVPGMRLLSVSQGEFTPHCCSDNHHVDVLGRFASGESRVLTLRLLAQQAGLAAAVANSSAAAIDASPVNNTARSLFFIAPRANMTPVEPGFVASIIAPTTQFAWSEPRQQVVANWGGGLALLDKDTLELQTAWPAPGEVGVFSLTPDGRHAWLGLAEDTLARLDLDNGGMDFSFPGPLRASAFNTIAAHPASPSLVLAIGEGNFGNRLAAVYDGGVRFPLTQQVPGGNAAKLAISPEGRVFILSGNELREFAVNTTGLHLVRDFGPQPIGWVLPRLTFARDRLFGVGGTITINLTDGSFAGLDPQLGAAVADDATGTVLSASGNSPINNGRAMIVQAWRAATLEPEWRREIPLPLSNVADIVPLGVHGVLMVSDRVRLLRTADLGTPETDLALSGGFRGEALGTNLVLSLDMNVTNHSAWIAHGARLLVEVSAGLELLPPAQPIISLGHLATGTNLMFELRTLQAGEQFVRIRAEADRADRQPANNIMELTFTTPPPPRLMLVDQEVWEGTVGNSLGVSATLTGPAPAEFDVLYRIEHLDTDAADVSGEQIGFRFHLGERRSRSSFIWQDSRPERDEKLRLVFAQGPVEPVTPAAVVTILNDDRPLLIPGAAQISEGDAGLTTARVPVRLEQAADYPVEVSYLPVSGSATAGVDFLPLPGRLVFTPGQRTNEAVVPLVGDVLFELPETVLVQFDDFSLGRYQTNRAVLTIRNDDAPPAPSARLARENPKQWRITFDTVPGAAYRLQTRTNLLQGAWQNVPGSVPGSGFAEMWLRPADLDELRFFRVVAE